MYRLQTSQVIPDTCRGGGVSGVQIVRKAEGRVPQADRVVLLAVDNELCRMAAHWLAGRFPGLAVIVEKRSSRRMLFRRRVERLGLVRVLGQLAFLGFSPLVRWGSRRRIQEIHREFALKSRWPEVDIIRVPSVNSPECLSHLRQLDPKVILVIGTRIISRAVLSAIPVPFINYHDGITPKYRGIRGGYWAKAENDIENFGVTIHLLDAGIDTGPVLYQARIKPVERDSYATFSVLQLATALPLIEKAALDSIAGTLTPCNIDLPSHLWTHPTLWSYILAGLRHGAW